MKYRENIRYQVNAYPFGTDSVFKRHPNGLKILESFMNKDITASEATKALDDIPGANIDNVRKTKDRVVKYFVNPDLKLIVDDPNIMRRELVSTEDRLKRISKGAKDVIIVDPRLGLHSLVADVEEILQDNMVDHANTMRYIALKAKIFELIMKHDSGEDITVDLDLMKRKTDLISLFVFDIASRVDQLIKDVGDEFRMKYSKGMIDTFMEEFTRRLDVKQLYLDFMDKVGDEFSD